jgi:hypothetical protein
MSALALCSTSSCQNAIKDFIQIVLKLVVFYIRTSHHQETQGVILKPEFLVVAHKTDTESDRMEKDVPSVSGCVRPVDNQ